MQKDFNPIEQEQVYNRIGHMDTGIDKLQRKSIAVLIKERLKACRFAQFISCHS